jgi:hypothetical protein
MKMRYFYPILTKKKILRNPRIPSGSAKKEDNKLKEVCSPNIVESGRYFSNSLVCGRYFSNSLHLRISLTSREQNSLM